MVFCNQHCTKPPRVATLLRKQRQTDAISDRYEIGYFTCSKCWTISAETITSTVLAVDMVTSFKCQVFNKQVSDRNCEQWSDFNCWYQLLCNNFITDIRMAVYGSFYVFIVKSSDYNQITIEVIYFYSTHTFYHSGIYRFVYVWQSVSF